ncbi:MAG: hypothetical protein J1F02_02645 [Lachnospiraceae bacterium]|nr:hypothetical protein [Lachnospiraceae bacterium]
MIFKASSICTLQNIKSGQIMTISATANCQSTGTIVIRDDSKVYATFKKTSKVVKYEYLGNASEIYAGGKDLRVEIDIEHTSSEISIKKIVDSTNLVNSRGNIVGTIYAIAIEDLKDDDYTDFVVTIAVTNQK